jgi:uncharacterized Ntn-hydrolase superfamily protein
MRTGPRFVVLAFVSLVAPLLVLVVPAPGNAAVMQGSMSIIGMDRATGTIGIAVVSDAPACGADVPWVQAGVGAIATQGEINPGWGPRGIAMLAQGVEPQVVCDSLYKSDPGFLRRQIGVLDRRGQPGGFTGLELIGFSGGVIDTFCAVQGNSLSYTDGLIATRDSFAAGAGLALPERLLRALAFGATRARGPLRSATLLVGRPDPEQPENHTRWISLRVDDSADPVRDLLRLYDRHAAARLVDSHLHFAALYEKAGSPAQAQVESRRAEELLARALADTSLGAWELNAMAWALAERGTHIDEAARAVDRALRLEPKNRSVLDTAAAVATRQGDPAAALAYAKRAAAAGPRDDYLRERARALGAPPAGGGGH